MSSLLLTSPKVPIAQKVRGREWGEWEEKMNHEKRSNREIKEFIFCRWHDEEESNIDKKKGSSTLHSLRLWVPFFLGYENITILNASMIFYQISLIINLNISEHRQNYHINQKKLLPYLRSVFVVCDIYRIRDIRQRIGMNRMERWVRVFVYNKFQYFALPVCSLTLAEICIIRCVKNLIKFGHIILEKCLDKRWSLHTRSNQTWKSLEIIKTLNCLCEYLC